MIPFDPSDPFPLFSDDAHTYGEAQHHAAQVDAWLGIQTEATEALISRSSQKAPGVQDWSGLPVQALLTPYTELRQILTKLSPATGTRVVDLGAAYGRLAFVLDRHWPDVQFIGYELVEARVQEGLKALARFGSKRARLIQADLSDPGFHPESAEFYFLYDFGSREAIEKCLQDLRDLARSRAVTVVGRGRASRDAIERGHPWLSQINPPRHFTHYSIYRS